MDYAVIRKPPVDEFRVRPNLDNYDERARFDYPDA